MRLQDVFGDDLQKYGIFPRRLDGKFLDLPSFTNLKESFNTYTPVSWSSTREGVNGRFEFEDRVYEIQLHPFTYPFDDHNFGCINIGFVVYVDGKPTTEITPSSNPMQLMSIITNAVNTKIIEYDIDALVLVSTNSVDSRSKLYNRLAYKYGSTFGKIYKNIKTNTGIATAIVSHNIPPKIHQNFLKFIESNPK